MKKLTTYQDVKDYCSTHVGGIDVDLYTDAELIQLSKWMLQAEHEVLLEKNLINLTTEEVSKYNFNNPTIINNIIAETPEKFVINNKVIYGNVIINYPEFNVVKEKDKNNFYKIDN